MVILGLCDALDAGAALVVDDRLVAVEAQERHDRVPRSRAFPWAAVEEVLEEAAIRPDHVDVVALAGRLSPPLALRRHPRLRDVTRDAFSPAHDVRVFYQALLRQSGLGAMEADRARDWLEELLRGNRFSATRVELVDVHRALAEAAYRSQGDDAVLVVTLHPMGDGVAVAVHRGGSGQLDKVWEQKGFASLHVHLQRCAAAIGFSPSVGEHLLWATAARGRPDPELVSLLDEQLRAEGPRLSRRGYPLPATRGEEVYRRLAAADPETAAASVLDNLCRAARAVVGYHVGRWGESRVCLAGAVFDNPRVAAAVAELPSVRRLWVPPEPGYGALARGAAATFAGLAPMALTGVGLGRTYAERQMRQALKVASATATRPDQPAAALAEALADGAAVARFQGRAGFGRHGLGTRSVLVRADDPAAIERARARLGRDPREEPLLAYLGLEPPGEVEGAGLIDDALRYGTVAPRVDDVFRDRCAGAVAADGRALLYRVEAAQDPVLAGALQQLGQRTGVAAVAVWPLAEESYPPVSVPGDALRVMRRAGLDAMLLGPFWIAA